MAGETMDRSDVPADGALHRPEAPQEVAQVIRVGDSLLVPGRDVEPMQQPGI